MSEDQGYLNFDAPDTRQKVIAELRKETEKRAHDAQGTHCPVCSKFVKVYRRKLHNEMARFLIKLVHAYKRYPRYYTMRELFPGNNKSASDGSYLVHWGLVERSDATNEAQAPAGSYRPTDKGLRFAHNNEFVPTHVHLLNNEVVGWSDRQTNIRTALGSKFNYEELMKS
ncbi:MAG: hypothetical protein DRP83_00770 [Planctomycetota bacterium]|nr:MAG: hypothetical protein DRP83_00770 [Planctomycetota bacterium]